MIKQKLNLRKKIGFILLAIVVTYWITFPIIPLLEIPHKACVMTVMAIGGEILLLIVIALFGKEYWHSMKHKFKRVYSTFKHRYKKNK
ncbi:transporter suffix domain-containing protein [Acinetobacter bereziniae]|uniref:transporter suffix domain-containing protein n=1 Tax=Acinetobacter bereziniae TaxID=106648 RepID=UPI0019020DEB|nr:transporter suffix domain-containing protein [Acinetobacter bereziniae]MBJ8442339.1 transporter suffix domain-containing protein [Acinetobacter bereziniae]